MALYQGTTLSRAATSLKNDQGFRVCISKTLGPKSLRENSALSPAGTSESSPGRRHGLGKRDREVPLSTVEYSFPVFIRPSRDCPACLSLPRTTSWATFSRPCGTKCRVLTQTLKAVPFCAVSFG